MNIQVHSFNSAALRICTTEGQPHFVARDIAHILGYLNPSEMAKTHCTPEGITKQVVITTQSPQSMTLMNLEGLLKLLSVSKKPNSRPLQKFIYSLLRRGGLSC